MKDKNPKGKQEYIQLVNCPQGGESCADHRKVINKSMLISRQHLMNKNYPLTFKELKVAFNKTNELTKVSCISCAKLFRKHIVQSMENIHDDLEKMSDGLFRKKRYKPDFILASEILEELKNKVD